MVPPSRLPQHFSAPIPTHYTLFENVIDNFRKPTYGNIGMQVRQQRNREMEEQPQVRCVFPAYNKIPFALES